MLFIKASSYMIYVKMDKKLLHDVLRRINVAER